MQKSIFGEKRFDTNWTMPQDLPSLSSAKIIAVDTETCDPDIIEKGPGWATGNGFVAGISIGTDDGYRQYFPIRHETGANLDADTVLRWLNTELSRPEQLKVGANIIYDVGWLRKEGVTMNGAFYCTHTAEWLIDESRRASLNYLGEKYLNENKTEDLMYKYCAEHFGGAPERKEQAKNIWRAPASVVGPYAESDVDLPLRIMKHQQTVMDRENLSLCFQTEMRLVNMLVDMRMRGIRVNTTKAKQLQEELQQRIINDQKILDNIAGFGVNVDASTDLARLFDALKLDYKMTAKSNEPSFTHTFLANHTHEVTDTILNLRKWKKFLSTFINGYIFGYTSNDRIHPEFNPLGARSGRFSSSNPNLQNVPARDEELGPLTRSMFLPDEGEKLTGLDYSQIEYRYLVHLGNDAVANELKRRYREDADTDIHQFVADLLDVDRKPGKNLNFGIVYGMGIYALAKSLNRSVDDAKALKQEYAKHFPFASQLAEQATEVAQNRGYVKTLLGRRSRFNKWEPKQYSKTKVDPLSKPEALEAWGRQIQRSYTYTALNRVIQGSAADILKMAMVNIYESGVCDVLGAPLLTVHDELIFSMPQNKAGKDAIQEVKYIMENAVNLSVPLKVDIAEGDNWGELK
ncbi:MAG: DNA polymerase [Nitrosopumilus sp.]|nr:DNA polymerase [Nitrosopumilus sp.]